ncbi:MAG: MerR family transcriptional regulator [Oscillibacter sp.]|jgi:DNA-binding transcriptional MerR regulator|nr:MerR family transcriptional regulator [Oscillibacter sp.]
MVSDLSRYTIGQMAKLCNITAKQLRFYDERSLIKPAFRDDRSGYRYYESWQIEEILLLIELKNLNFSLSQIKEVLGCRNLESLQNGLESQLYKLRKERNEINEKYDSTINSILRVLHGISFLNGNQQNNIGNISVVSFPPTDIAYTRSTCYWKADRLFISRRAELLQLVDKYHLKATDSNMAIFHSDPKKQFSDDPQDMEGDLEVCIRVKNPNFQLPCCRKISGIQAVSCVFVGPYSDMLSAYLALENYAAQRTIKLHNSSIEEYLVGATMTGNAADYVTRIYLPIDSGTGETF